MGFIYLDNAATTKVRKEVIDAMLPYFDEKYFNASSLYSLATEVKKDVVEAREKIASYFNCKADEIYFTSCGSESDNWALKGTAFKYEDKGKHIITTAIEHPAILNTCKFLEKEGFEVTYLSVDEDGFIDLNELENAMRDDTILVSIMFANNEIGTIQPIKEAAAIAHKHNALFHTDAVQAVGNVRIDVEDLGIDMMSLSGHKLYGPKGIGALYIRKGVNIDNLIHGGGQERKRRAGTENTAEIIGLAKAIELLYDNFEKHNNHLREKRDRLVKEIMEKIPYTLYNGSKDPERRLPGNASFCFKYVEGEALLLMLDAMGIAGSTGSACASGSLDPSHVLLAIGLPHEIAHGSLRLTFSEEITDEDVDYVVDSLVKIIERLRQMSPLYDEAIAKGEI